MHRTETFRRLCWDGTRSTPHAQKTQCNNPQRSKISHSPTYLATSAGHLQPHSKPLNARPSMNTHPAIVSMSQPRELTQATRIGQNR